MVEKTKNGISVLLPTYNMLDYLKICLKSLDKNSSSNTEVCVVVDGCTDGTEDWLTQFLAKEHRISIKVATRSQQKGAYSGWNLAAKISTKSHVLVGEDDFYYGPFWDEKLLAWIHELRKPSVDHNLITVISHDIIEPFPGSYQHYDCGDGPAGRPFDERKLLDYIEPRLPNHTLRKQVFNMPFMSRKLWDELGGYDEQFDPVTTGTVDLLVRLHKKILRSYIVHDSMVYHFKPQVRLIEHKVSPDYVKLFQEKNHEKFLKKWGFTVSEALKKLEKGGKS